MRIFFIGCHALEAVGFGCGTEERELAPMGSELPFSLRFASSFEKKQ